jgi:hypothetical protein
MQKGGFKNMRLITKKVLLGIAAVTLTAGLSIPATGLAAKAEPAPQKGKVEQKGAYVPAEKPLNFKHEKRVSANKQAGMENIRGPVNPAYKLNVSYDSAAHKVNGKLEVTFKNNIKNNLSELFFNLWGNADMFKENGGSMSVADVTVNGKKAEFITNGTALHITKLALQKNKSATVKMNFQVGLPEQQDRFGWYGDTVSFGNWFPILAVYDDEGWNVDPYFPYGESFYSLNSKFDVTVTTDKSQVIAATGTKVAKTVAKGNKATHRYKASNVRDFAMEMNPNYKVISTNVDGIKVNVYYSEKHSKYAAALLESGKDSLKLFNKKFGKYAWPELDIVSMEGWFGGMEYPQLVMISLPGERPLDWVKSVNAHEIGHQWFYGMIGNNEYDEPWLDESFASFAAALYDGELGQLTTEPHKDPYYHLSSQIAAFTARADQDGISAYYSMIYGYGSRTINDLRKELGDKVFYKAMQYYFKNKKFGITTTKDFISDMEKASNRDLSAFFREHRVNLSDQE